MDETKVINIKVGSEVLEKFDLALQLNKEDKNEVLTRLMIQYISESFSKASRAFITQPTTRANYLGEEDTNYAKANRKIPTWARKPQQNNHRIIKAFFELEVENGIVLVQELAERCNDVANHPETLVSDFKGNFAQMKTDASNSHGKVFVVNDDVVEIWDEVRNTLIDNKHLFLLNSNGETRMNKITNEMVQTAYEFAKKVYSGELTRSEGKYEIEKLSGMSSGSAQDFITDFLAMMEGKVYHRTMSNFGTSYFLENIRKDFGEDAFRIALEATEKHIEYYNNLGNGQLKAKEEIVRRLKESLE